jgi:hypothetical protein
MLAIGLLIGFMIKLSPIKSLKRKFLVLCVTLIVSGVGLSIPALFYSGSLVSIYFFDSFYYALTSIAAIGSNAPFVVAITLIVILEVSLSAGFAAAIKIDEFRSRGKLKSKSIPEVKSYLKPNSHSNDEVTSFNGRTSPHTLSKNQENADLVDEQGLRKDEQSLMELFIYGKVKEILPIVDSSSPEGYFFDGFSQLNWDTKRARQTLNSLVRKGFLKAELTDKVIICVACGSPSLRIKKLCPDCLSLRLRKEVIIEHLPCRTVDTQTAFENSNGDLVCPNCKDKLQLIGSDYRILPSAYTCLSCNVRSSEPLIVVKCNDCGSTAQLDEEPEVLLYKYNINSEMTMQELQQIKPVEICANFFKSLGYTIVTPAFVSGRSGIQHLFDILVLGRVGWTKPYNPIIRKSAIMKDNGNTVIEVLISNKPIDVREMTRIYGMINDIECDSLIFVIPGLTENARNYSSAYDMKISEGKTIEEALANSKIPKEMPRIDEKNI